MWKTDLLIRKIWLKTYILKCLNNITWIMRRRPCQILPNISTSIICPLASGSKEGSWQLARYGNKCTNYKRKGIANIGNSRQETKSGENQGKTRKDILLLVLKSQTLISELITIHVPCSKYCIFMSINEVHLIKWLWWCNLQMRYVMVVKCWKFIY